MPEPFSPSLGLLAQAYASFERDPATVEPSLRRFFNALSPTARAALRPDGADGESAASEMPNALLDSVRAVMLIRAVRTRGHSAAKLDPLTCTVPAAKHPELDPAAYGFRESDMDRPLFLGGMLGRQTATLREIVALLSEIYEGSLGVEYTHLQNPAQKAWIQEFLEGPDRCPALDPERKRLLFDRLAEVEGFETFMQERFPQTTRFSLEGAEALIPLLDTILSEAAHEGLEQAVIGMAHRGRLNVLCHILDKPRDVLFAACLGGATEPTMEHFAGDLKYHLGAHADKNFNGRRVHLSLAANPSHLAFIAPVVLGRVRAKQDDPLSLIQPGASARHKIMGLLIHGDSAFAGQGIVPETLNLANLESYKTGGAIHIVVNNRIGYTTGAEAAFAGVHCTDAAKIIQAPLLHVNADDPESIVYAARLAARFRQKFHSDIVIDLVAYRRRGHDEKDEPFITQPLLYEAITRHASVREIYGRKLMDAAILTPDENEKTLATVSSDLRAALSRAGHVEAAEADWLQGHWRGIEVATPQNRGAETGVPMLSLNLIADRLFRIPDGFRPHHKVADALRHRAQCVQKGHAIDWPTAEALALGALLSEGYPVRFAGQDSVRGASFLRHFALVDQATGESYIPLANLAPDQAHFSPINSPLSEAAALGFEYGYATVDPETLVCWEAQYGDFVNGAQVIIDQFIASAEAKWLRMAGLVLLLPHGYEGQGAEHSAARIERFLQLSADDNWIVAQCTTPANYFHILRRQVKSRVRKPLVLFTPKGAVRDNACRSPLFEMGAGAKFQSVIGEQSDQLVPDNRIRRVVLCSGRIYYDLAARRDAARIRDVALVRMEQLYPFPMAALQQELSLYPKAEFIWCQEEPRGTGAYAYIAGRIEAALAGLGRPGARVGFIGRPESAAPATGILARHLQEQDALLRAAFQTYAQPLTLF